MLRFDQAEAKFEPTGAALFVVALAWAVSELRTRGWKPIRVGRRHKHARQRVTLSAFVSLSFSSRVPISCWQGQSGAQI